MGVAGENRNARGRLNKGEQDQVGDVRGCAATLRRVLWLVARALNPNPDPPKPFVLSLSKHCPLWDARH